MIKRNLFAVSAAILLALLFFAYPQNTALAQDPKCGLLKDCTFDNFNGNGEPCSADWKCGNPNGIGLTESEGWPKGPSLTFVGSQPFDRVVWQTVSVTPGKGYRFFAPFAVVNVNGTGWHEGDQVNRRLGIDPFGGVDPNSPNIKWSPDFFLKGRFQDDQLQISEYARADRITVFIRVINPYSDKKVDVFVDTPGLVENPDMPPIQVTAPTVTPPPPPPTQPVVNPTRIVPTAKPTQAIEPTETPAPTEQPTEPPTPTTVPSQTPRAQSTTVANVQTTARPTRLRASASQATAASDAVAPSQIELGTIGVIGVAGISGALLLAILGAVLLLRRK